MAALQIESAEKINLIQKVWFLRNLYNPLNVRKNHKWKKFGVGSIWKALTIYFCLYVKIHYSLVI